MKFTLFTAMLFLALAVYLVQNGGASARKIKGTTTPAIVRAKRDSIRNFLF
jgi:hypothetical protein